MLGRWSWWRGQAEWGAWVVWTVGWGCLRWVERLGAGLAAVTVCAVALIWKLVWNDILTIREIIAADLVHTVLAGA